MCGNVDRIPGADLIPELVSTCESLATGLLALNNLQEVVNHAVVHLWTSDNERVTLVDGNGLAHGTSQGNMVSVTQALEMEHKESVPEAGPTESGQGHDRENGVAVALAPGACAMSAEAFRQAVICLNGADGGVMRAAGKDASAHAQNGRIARAAASGDWNPRYRFSFDYSDSQTGESDGHGSMAVRGVIGFEMPVHFYPRYSDWTLRRFVETFKPTQYPEIEVEVNGDADISRTLAETKAPSIKFFIGPLPVYVRPIFEVSVHGEAEGSGVVFTVVDYEVDTGYSRVFHDPEIADGDFTLKAYGRVEPRL